MRIPATVNGEKVSVITVDTVADILCNSEQFISAHRVLHSTEMHPRSEGIINLKSIHGSLKICGNLRLNMTLGETISGKNCGLAPHGPVYFVTGLRHQEQNSSYLRLGQEENISR